MSEFEKAQKNLKNDMFVLFILEVFLFGLSLLVGETSIFAIGFAVLLSVGYNLARKGSQSAGIIGIIVGVLMMITIVTGDIIDFLLGLFVLMHSLKYNKSFVKKA